MESCDILKYCNFLLSVHFASLGSQRRIGNCFLLFYNKLLQMGATVTTPGGVVAEPMVGEIFEQIVPLLNVKKDYKNQIEKELRWYIDTPYHNVPNFININKSKIKTSPYYKYLCIGDGNTVIDQEQVSGERIPEGGTIILYLG